MLTRASIARVAEDLLRAEIAAARPGDLARLPQGPWPDHLPLGPQGIGADSLELLALAGAVNEKFHIHEVGLEDSLLVEPEFGAWLDLIMRARGPHISFRTSGSTGSPRRCTHNLADLLAETDAHAALLAPGRILSAVPAHHIYGFIFTVLLPQQTGCEVIDISRRLPPSAAFQAGDVIISFPDHWRFLARSFDRLPPVCGVSSTAPMPPDLGQTLRSGGLARLVEIYGSSETAGLGWRDATDAPFRLLDNWSVQAAPEGEGILHLCGTARDAATPDIVAMASAREFHVRRRVDGAVQVGGVNVYPAQVARVLEKHPLIAQARVRQAAAAAGGRLKALIVTKDATIARQDLRVELDRWMATHLAPPERPRSVTIAACPPTGALGKECDWTETECPE